MLKIICITLLITPYISGFTLGIKTHTPAGSNDVQSHYRVEYSSPLTTSTHTDQSSYSSQYSKSFKTDSNGNVILSSSDNGDHRNNQFNDANHLNGADNLGTSSYVVKHETRRIGDNSGYDAFVDNTLNRNLQEHQNILENIQGTYGKNSALDGSNLGSSISHQGSLGESHLGSSISHQKSGSYASSASHGNIGAYGSDLQSSSSHQGSSNLGTSNKNANEYGSSGLGTSISHGTSGSYGSNNLGTKITHHNSRLESSNYGTGSGNSGYDRPIQTHGSGAYGSGLETSVTHSTIAHGTGLGASVSHQGSGSYGSSVSHGNKGYGLDSGTYSQGTYGSGLGSSATHSSSTLGTGLGTSVSHQLSGSYGSNIGSSVSHGNNRLESSDLGSSISHSNKGYGLNSGTYSQGTYGSGLGSSVTHSSNTLGTGLGTSVSHQGSGSYGSNLGSSISYGSKQTGDFGLSSSHSASSGYGSGGSTYDIYSGSNGPDLYQQHFSYVKSHKFSKCPPGVTGQFALPDNCHKFLNCWQGDGHVQECGAGTVYNEKIRGCDFPSGNAHTC